MHFKRVLLSAGVIIFVGAVVAGATGAFFTDEETSSGNVFAAGAIDLQIDNTSYGFDWNRPGEEDPEGEWGENPNNTWQLDDLTDQLFFDFEDLKPGDYGEDTISLHVDDNDAWACMAFNLTGTPENELTEPEEEVDNTDGEDEGELQNYLSFLFWWDDGDNVLEEGEEVIEELSGLPGAVFTGSWLAIADTENEEEPLQGDTTHYIGKGWCFGEITPNPVDRDLSINEAPTAETTGFTCNGAGDHNDAQTDGIEVDVAFHAVQSRNNDDFLCSQLPPLEEEDRESVGAALGAYVPPSDVQSECDFVVGNESGATNSTIQDALDASSDDETICVQDDTFDETPHIQTEIVLLSLTGADNTATIDGGVIVDAANVTVSGFKVIPGDTEGTTAGFYLKEPADNAMISYNDIDGSSAGGVSRGIVNVISTDLPGVVIEYNHIHDLTTGIYTNPHTGQWTIQNNDIDDNLAGIGQWNGADILNNEFEDTDGGAEAIGVDETFDDNTGVANFNNFLNGMKLNTYDNEALETLDTVIDAENNFFGPSGGATQVDETNGVVDFDPEAGSAFPHN